MDAEPEVKVMIERSKEGKGKEELQRLLVWERTRHLALWKLRSVRVCECVSVWVRERVREREWGAPID